MMSEFSRRWIELRNNENRAVLMALGLLVLVLLVLFCLLAYVVWRQNYASAAETAPVAADANQVVGEDAWNRIQTRGKILVGVSPDYPPFASVDASFNLVGFDIALANEIGRRLNYPVEFVQMPFGGVLEAVRLGQVDLGVGGISVTPERQALVDFTNVYYRSEEAALAHQSSQIAIVRVEDYAPLRVGVVRDSSYHTWLKDALVTPGLMPNERLQKFETTDAMVTAVLSTAPTVDVILMDLLPAQNALQGQPLKLVGRGLFPQSYAVAIPKNSPTLLSLLNQTLLAMDTDGTLARLQNQYLNVAVVQPTAIVLPTPPIAILPTATFIVVIPTAELPIAGSANCTDGMAYVEDLNYPDENMVSPPQFAPGQSFQKGWRIRNTGTCTWDASYHLAYAGAAPKDAPVSGAPVAISGRVEPGAVTDVYVQLTAPAETGVYQSLWALRSPRDEVIGEQLWAGIEVSASATAPTPRIPLAPAASSDIAVFSAVPQSLQAGQCVTLSWQFTPNGAAVLKRGTATISEGLPATGSFVDCPSVLGSVEYTLSVGTSTTRKMVVIYPGSGEAAPTATRTAP